MSSLTIVIPTVNRLALLKKALASVLAQTVPVEIIVSDNGSSDGTETFLPSLDLPINVRRFRHEPMMTVQRHGAFLVSKVDTEWTVFLSDDDFLEPEFAEGVLELVQAMPQLALVYTGCDMIFGDVALPATVGPRFEDVPDFLYNFMAGKRNICMCATAYRTADLRTIGQLPDTILIGDMHYLRCILAKGGVVGCAQDHLSNYLAYRPSRTNQTNRMSVLAWATETKGFVQSFTAIILADSQTRHDSRAVSRVARRFVSLTVSNHFAWNALRGVGKLGLVKASFRLAGLILGSGKAVVRVAGVLLMPRPILERLVLAQARRQARAAGRRA
jgi:hypothetical protein